MTSVRFLSILVIAAFAIPAFSIAQDPILYDDPDPEVDNDVKAILKKSCYKCHSGTRAKADFRMDKVDTLAEHIGPGKNIVPGKPQESMVIELISLPERDDSHMPPPGRADPMPASHKRRLVAWITQGAKLEADAPGVPAEPTATPEPVAADAPDPNALHKWVSAKSGKAINAKFVRIEGANVVLQSESGQERAFPGAMFNKESQELAKALARAQK